MAPPCRFFALGTCRNGSSCPFAHVASGGSGGGDAAKPPCKFFASGTCRFGAGCAFSHDIPAGGPLDQDFGGPLPGGPPPPGGYYGGGPPMPAGAYPGGPVPPPFGAFPGGFPPPPQFGRPGFGFMPPQGPPMHGYGGGPQPGMDEYDSDEDVPPTPAYEIRPGMTFEEIMALKKSAPHEFSDRAGVFDPNLALDALDEHVAALRDYLAQITRRAPAAGASDPLVLPRSYPKPSGSFAAVRRIFDRLRQTKALEAVNGGKVDDAGFMVIVGMGEMDEQLRSLGISYGSSLFPVRESGWIALMEYAEANCDPEMQSIVSSFLTRMISRNADAFRSPRAIVSLEDDYDTHPLPSAEPTSVVKTILDGLAKDSSSIVLPAETNRIDLATLLARLPSTEGVTSLSAISSGLPATDLGRLFERLPKLDKADLSSIPSLSNDVVQTLARLCPNLKDLKIRGHPDDHATLDEGVLTAVAHGTQGCNVDCADQLFLGRGFVEGTVAKVWKGRGGGKINVGEAGDESEI